MVIRPWGMAIWDSFREDMDKVCVLGSAASCSWTGTLIRTDPFTGQTICSGTAIIRMSARFFVNHEVLLRALKSEVWWGLKGVPRITFSPSEALAHTSWTANLNGITIPVLFQAAVAFSVS